MKELLKLILIVIVAIIVIRFVFNLLIWSIGGLVTLACFIAVLYGIVWLVSRIFR
jgi:hypothetical protein